jgi:hypothetical protein
MEAELERRRLEDLRARSVELSDQIRQSIAKLSSTGLAGLVDKELLAIEDSIRHEPGTLSEERQLANLQRAMAELSHLAELANLRMKEREATLNQARISLDALRLELVEVAAILGGDYARQIGELVRKVDLRLNRADESLEDGLESFISEVWAEADAIKQDAEERTTREEIRRHIVGSLVSSMREVGLVVGGPKILTESDKVAVVGTMASGRMVRFDVGDTGCTEFNLDGYEGRECANHLDQILLQMRSMFDVETGPLQHNWKNPDRISKGSKGHPSGGSIREMEGGYHE